MQINTFKILKDNYIIFILFNFIILSSTFFFFDNVQKGVKYTTSFELKLIDELKDLPIEVNDNLIRRVDFASRLGNLIQDRSIKKTFIAYNHSKSRININFITYDQNLTKKQIINFLNKFINETNLEINKNLLIMNAREIKIVKNLLSEKGFNLNNFLRYNFNNDFANSINNAENITELNSLKEEFFNKFYYFDPEVLFKNKFLLLFYEKINENIAQNKYYSIYAIPEFAENDFKKSPIYFQNFEYVFVIIMILISLIASFILIIILNYNKLSKYQN